MVHALEEIHRLLKPDGILIDIHPEPEGPIYKVFQGDRTLFSERKRATCSEDVLQAENALAISIQNNLYSVDQQGEFDFLIYASSVKELVDYWEEMNEFEEESKDEETLAREKNLYTRIEKVMQTVGRDAEAATFERVLITRLHPVKN
jgi:SAM-dependent methyltransferase